MRIAAIRSLGANGRDEAVPVLLNIAKTDSDTRARMAAVQALGQIGTPKAKEALLQIIGKEE